MSLSYNPAVVTNAAGSFYATSDGAVQGFYQDDPAIRFQLRSGLVAPSQSTPLWGGMAITVALPATGVEASSFKAMLALATSQANVAGFTVFNQAHAMVLNPSASTPVPLAAAGASPNPGGAINFFLLGSQAQIWVQCSSAVAAAFKSGGGYQQAAYWDYTNQLLLSSPGGTALGVEVVDVVTNGNAAVVASGGNSWNYAGYAALIKI
jgi:hypothetical protein